MRFENTESGEKHTSLNKEVHARAQIFIKKGKHVVLFLCSTVKCYFWQIYLLNG
jgi:hypothetical protein